MVYADSHCHLSTYPPEQIPEMLRQVRKEHIDVIVSVGTDLESSAETTRLTQSYEGVLAAVGIHPWNAVLPNAEVRRQLSELIREEQVVAIGEIGLDYARNPQSKEVQKELLRYELSLAQETGLPVNIHCREAHEDMMDILDNNKTSLKGVIHGFSGDINTLNDWLNLGFYISVGVRGFVTNELDVLLEAVRAIPHDRLLTETDAVASLQADGPIEVISVVQKLASVRGAAVEDIANAATTNLKRLLKR